VVDCGGVDLVWIEWVARPRDEFVMSVVGRVGDGFEKVTIAGWAADVLGRAASGRADEEGISDPRMRRSDSLDLDTVPPEVAEIVEVGERRAPAVIERGAQRRLRASSGPSPMPQPPGSGRPVNGGLIPGQQVGEKAGQ